MKNIQASIKEDIGYTCEEVGDVMGTDGLTIQCRRLRNEGRIEKGKTPKLTKPGTENKTKEQLSATIPVLTKLRESA